MNRWSGVRSGAWVLVGWLLATALSRALASGSDTLSTSVWLATGVALGAATVAPRWHLAPILAGAALASVIVALFWDGYDIRSALVFGLIEALATGAGAWLARQGRRSGQAFPAWAALVGGALLAALVGASAAVVLWGWLKAGALLATEWWIWSASTFVGTLLVAPVLTAFAGFRPRRSGGMGMLQFAAGAAAFLLFLFAAALVFQGQAEHRFGASLGPTLAYLPLPFMVLAALLWGPRGGALAVLAGALALIGWTATGQGPFAAVEGFRGEALIEVQWYVAVMALLAGLVVALQAGRDQALAEARQWRLRFRQVLQSTHSTTVSIDAVSGACSWGDDAAAVLGGPPPARVVDWIAAADAAEQPLMKADWAALVAGRQPSALWRQATPSGAALVARLAPVEGPDGAVEQVAALVQRPLGAADGAA